MSFLVLAVLLLIFYVLFKRFEPHDRPGRIGRIGERQALDTVLQQNTYGRVLTNLYLPTNTGSTTEVDLLWVCTQGIFVLEVKHYSGWIFGNERNQYWTQVIKGGHKSRFYNPLWQNRAHIAALRSLLYPTYMGSYFNVVVFSDHCTLKDVSFHSERTTVLQQEDLAHYLSMMTHSLPKIIEKERVDLITAQLTPYGEASPGLHDRHIQSIDSNYKRY
ncbi:MAG TPA: nuclease-related domain-containing protein [Sphaerochaeta sp.]|jgi:hypothetical protein|nr:nuclease-related domain-containing protein [Sphaerochaeta sp.]HPZ16172.1 nuclease-related domain-containing protein [Sphaerochaeta sp.]